MNDIEIFMRNIDLTNVIYIFDISYNFKAYFK